MKKKWLLISALCLLMVVSIAGFKTFTSYSSVLETNWGFRLPFKALCREIYELSDPPSFHGDGIRYHVYAYRYEDYIALMFPWRTNEIETVFQTSFAEEAESWLDQINVPSQWRPSYDPHDCSYWYKSKRDNSQIILVWDQTLNRLYIAESFL